MDIPNIKIDSVELEPKIRKMPKGKLVTKDGEKFKVVPEDYELQDGEFWFSFEEAPDLKCIYG